MKFIIHPKTTLGAELGAWTQARKYYTYNKLDTQGYSFIFIFNPAEEWLNMEYYEKLIAQGLQKIPSLAIPLLPVCYVLFAPGLNHTVKLLTAQRFSTAATDHTDHSRVAPHISNN